MIFMSELREIAIIFTVVSNLIIVLFNLSSFMFIGKPYTIIQSSHKTNILE